MAYEDCASPANAGDDLTTRLHVKIEQEQRVLVELRTRRDDLVKHHLRFNDQSEARTIDERQVSQAIAESKEVIKQRIDLLQRYNEIKDIGTALIGMIAEAKQQRMADAMTDFGLEHDD